MKRSCVNCGVELEKSRRKYCSKKCHREYLMKPMGSVKSNDECKSLSQILREMK